MDKGKKYRRTIEGQRAMLMWDEWAWIVQGVDREVASHGDTPQDAEDNFVYQVRFWTHTDAGKEAGGIEAVIAPPPEIAAWWDEAEEAGGAP